MHGTGTLNGGCEDLRGFSQTRFFYGQRLDVRHFEAEQNYVKGKLWMLNRLVHGYGVVCGLDVRVDDDHQSVLIKPGIALDKAGREIVVPCDSRHHAIPPLDPDVSGQGKADTSNSQECCDDDFVHVCVCFQSCDADPEPVLAGVCDSVERCSPGAIRERFKIEVRPGRSQPIPMEPVIGQIMQGSHIDYKTLARWVTEPCLCVPEDTCIPLANVKRPQPGGTVLDIDIEIEIRPIVYTNDLLFQILLAITNMDQQGARRTGK